MHTTCSSNCAVQHVLPSLLLWHHMPQRGVKKQANEVSICPTYFRTAGSCKGVQSACSTIHGWGFGRRSGRAMCWISRAGCSRYRLRKLTATSWA